MIYSILLNGWQTSATRRLLLSRCNRLHKLPKTGQNGVLGLHKIIIPRDIAGSGDPGPVFRDHIDSESCTVIVVGVGSDEGRAMLLRN